MAKAVKKKVSNRENLPNLEKILYTMHENNIKNSPQMNNRASSIGSPCLRQLVYNRIAWKEKEPTTLRGQLIFDEGNLHERAVTLELLSMGVMIIKQQAGGLHEPTNISYHLDGAIVEAAREFPFDVKSCADYIYKAIEKYNEWEFKRAMDELGTIYPWLKKYPGQVVTYLNAENVDIGIILFKNKQTGQLKQFYIDRNEHAEYFIELCNRSNQIDAVVENFKKKKIKFDDVKAEKMLPERLNDSEECKWCAHRFHCLPDVDFGTELTFLNDKEVEEKIHKWHNYAIIAKEYKNINDDLSKWSRGKNEMVGPFHVGGKFGKDKNWRKKILIVQQKDIDALEEESAKLITALNKKRKQKKDKK